jgi:pilus assembly protein CpaC
MFRSVPLAARIAPVLAIGAVLCAGVAHAQNRTPAPTPGAMRDSMRDVSGQITGSPSMQRINMGVGKSVIVDLPRDAAEIFVGNPKVVNAVVRSARRLYVIGAATGQTTIFAMDSTGQTIATVEINIGRDVGELMRILRMALPDSDVVARTVDDTIILTGTVASLSDAQKASDIAYGFLGVNKNDGAGAGGGEGGGAAGAGAAGGVNGRIVNTITVRGRDQVMLKVTISEVQRTVVKQLGVTSSQLNGNWGSLKLSNALSNPNSSLTVGGGNNVSATLSAFERYGVARVLAEPTVTAVSGEVAKFMVGGEVPVPSGQSCGVSNDGRQVCTPGGATFKPYGISLNFAPIVLAEGRIALKVSTEVTEVDNTQATTIAGTKVQAFRTRRNETSVELPSGGSIVSAGLLQMNSRHAIEGLPGLVNLPILGSLFRSREYQRDETELLIIVTPYIAKSSNATALARPDDGFADASDPQAWFLGRVNKLYAAPGANPSKPVKGRFGFIFD